MARILLFVTNTMADSGPDMLISGQATIEGAIQGVNWQCSVPWGSGPNQVNNACEAAAVAAAAAAGFNITNGLQDRITLAPAKAI